MTFDSCHEKIDLFGVQNIVIPELLWWKCIQAHQPGKYFSGWLSNFRLFWYQIYCSSSIRTNFTQVLRPKNCQYFQPRRGLFSRDHHKVHQRVDELSAIQLCYTINYPWKLCTQCYCWIFFQISWFMWLVHSCYCDKCFLLVQWIVPCLLMSRWRDVSDGWSSQEFPGILWFFSFFMSTQEIHIKPSWQNTLLMYYTQQRYNNKKIWITITKVS